MYSFAIFAQQMTLINSVDQHIDWSDSIDVAAPEYVPDAISWISLDKIKINDYLVAAGQTSGLMPAVDK